MSDAPAPPTSDHFIVRARWVVLVVLLAVCSWLIPGVSELEHDDDVLAFLPPEDPDVVAFREVADRFGMLEVALVGVRTGESLLESEPTEKVRALATKLDEVTGVRLVMAYPDFPEAKVVDETLIVQSLVPDGLSNEEIRERVLSNTNAVGNFISADGNAAAILIYLNPATGKERARQRSKELADIRAVVDENWEGEAFYGGAPFMETAASNASREDIERLSPIVIGVLVIASALLLGSVTAAGLNLVITGLGVALIVGSHGRFAEPFTIVSSTTPVMMVALGGAFGMHMLAGFQRNKGSSRERASETIRELWKPVVLSGLTTATAFFALLVMPQVPMQRFGVVAGFGVLLLLLLALVAMPALLAIMPSRLLPSRENPHLPMRWMPPLWLVAVIGIAGAGLGSQLSSDPDTNNLFAEDSGPRKANDFFNEHFEGSQFLQIAIEADLTQPVALREIREMVTELRAVEGVVDVRSLVEPVATVSEGFGGRRGIPQTQPRTQRVVKSLADHPAMAQLMVPEADAAIVHIKLAPGGGEHQQRVTKEVRAIVAAHDMEQLRVGKAQAESMRPVVMADVRARLAALVGEDIDEPRFAEIVDAKVTAASMMDELTRLRDRALGTDELIEPLPEAERAAVDPAKLFDTRGPALKKYLETALPALAEKDPEGIDVAAEFVGEWVDEAIEAHRFTASCTALGLPPPPAPPAEDPFGLPPEEGEKKAEEEPADNRCQEVLWVLAELNDETWGVPVGMELPDTETLAWKVRLTGQPVIGQAFASSVSTSLQHSTLVSLGALAVVLLVFGQLRALVPAVWTLLLTAGSVFLLGHPISIGTSMVACIALGAGVDFSIHLGVRARQDGDGETATNALGGVILVTGLQLAAAFLVLLASEMPPLQQFGVGLALGLLAAAAGAVWLTPRLYPRR